MDINIIGNGSFGTFLKKELVNYGFKLDEDAGSVILAVPFSSYEIIAKQINNPNILLINICSVQKPSTDILLKYTDKVLSIHPLFGARTPADKRNSILTYRGDNIPYVDFMVKWINFSRIRTKDQNGIKFTPESHDKLMAKTHLATVHVAKVAKVFTDAAADIPDELIPNSFRLLREFVKTLDDMPAGTIESIMANPYI